ncbi:MAG TPA: hypothetical protein VFG02_05180, partial [Nitrospirota bacterium]|nr:hypothetical protein [Nitrospirota bacterium]
MRIPIPPAILDMLVPAKLFARLNIASKMLLGYMTLVLLTVIVVVYALISLQRINSLNKSIVQVDIVVQEAADKMLDALLAQDTFEKRYFILRSEDMRSLFSKRGDEFRLWRSTLRRLPEKSGVPIEALDALYKRYTDLFNEEIALIQMGKIKQASAISSGDLKNTLERLLDTIRTMSATAKESQDFKMKRISTIGGTAFYTTSLLCIFSIVAGAVAGLVVTHHISSSINRLKVATEHIAEGNFDFDPEIKTKD